MPAVHAVLVEGGLQVSQSLQGGTFADAPITVQVLARPEWARFRPSSGLARRRPGWLPIELVLFLAKSFRRSRVDRPGIFIGRAGFGIRLPSVAHALAEMNIAGANRNRPCRRMDALHGRAAEPVDGGAIPFAASRRGNDELRVEALLAFGKGGQQESSTSLGSMPLRSTSAFTTAAARSSGLVLASAPLLAKWNGERRSRQ